MAFLLLPMENLLRCLWPHVQVVCFINSGSWKLQDFLALKVCLGSCQGLPATSCTPFHSILRIIVKRVGFLSMVLPIISDTTLDTEPQKFWTVGQSHIMCFDVGVLHGFENQGGLHPHYNLKLTLDPLNFTISWLGLINARHSNRDITGNCPRTLDDV